MAHFVEIVLATINARYSHTSFGLRWIWSNLGPLKEKAIFREFTLNQSPEEIARSILSHQPRIIGLGVYVWNIRLLTEVARQIKEARPESVLVIGGPEVSHDYESLELYALADHLVRGEGEDAFRELAEAVLEGRRSTGKVIEPTLPDLSRLTLPYTTYTDEDIERRVIYVETSRGCPFRCGFCLSSLDARVREFPLGDFVGAMATLIARGARQFKFVDRTYNLRYERMAGILEFFLDQWQEGMRLHFEIVGDRLTEPMLDLLGRFPRGGLHLEIGVQSFNPTTLRAISRLQDTELILRNLRRLKDMGAVLHADLIVGLPHETWTSFAAGFDQLAALDIQELQVGILKRLRGAPLAQDANAHRMAFNESPPYEIIETDALDASEIEKLKRFARYFDLYYNSGNYPQSLPLLWRGPSRQGAAAPCHSQSTFAALMDFSERNWAVIGRTYALPLVRQMQLLYEYLIAAGLHSEETIATAIRSDYYRLPGRRDKLDFLAS